MKPLLYLFICLALACGKDEAVTPDPIDDVDPGPRINLDVWVDPTIVGDNNTGMKVHVWFDEQLIGFDEDYLTKTTEYALGRRALRQQLVGELKDMNAASMSAAAQSLDSLMEAGVIGSVQDEWIVNGFNCVINAGGILALSHVPGVHSIFQALSPLPPVNAVGPKFHTPDGSQFSYNPTDDKVIWSIDSLHVPRVWTEFGITGLGSKNVVHDFGFSFDIDAISNSLYTNPGEIPNNDTDDDGNGYIDDYHGYDFELNTSTLNVFSTIGSINHGNSVAALICGRSVNDTIYGIAPNAKWAGVMGASEIGEAVQWAIEQEFDTYTMSFSIPNLGDLRGYWRKVSEHAALCGLYLISGAGNFANQNNANFAPVPVQMRTPEDIPHSIFGVAGLDALGNRPVFSSQGPVRWFTHHYNEGTVEKPDFATYNAGIITLGADGSGNISVNGNSFAGPHLAGIISLMLEANPDLNVWEGKEILIQASTDILGSGKDSQSGYGLVDAYRAVELVR